MKQYVQFFLMAYNRFDVSWQMDNVIIRDKLFGILQPNRDARSKIISDFLPNLFLHFELNFFLKFELHFNLAEDYVRLCFVLGLFFLLIYSLKAYLKGLW